MESRGERESGHSIHMSMKRSGEGCICLWARKCTANPFPTELPNAVGHSLLLLANKTDNLPILGCGLRRRAAGTVLMGTAD